MKTLSVFLLFAGFGIPPAVNSVGSEPPLPSSQEASRGTFVDSRDGERYAWVQIGTQVWMAENLAFRTESGSWCYDDDEARCREYGRLYDWETAQTACPQGWRIPSKEDWGLLRDTLRSDSYRKLIVGGGSGFEAKLAGDRFYDGTFRGLGSGTHFWANTKSYVRRAGDPPGMQDHAFEALIAPDYAELTVGS